jgi:DNA-binding ferritin-like protein (Dps family)
MHDVGCDVDNDDTSSTPTARRDSLAYSQRGSVLREEEEDNGNEGERGGSSDTPMPDGVGGTNHVADEDEGEGEEEAEPSVPYRMPSRIGGAAVYRPPFGFVPINPDLPPQAVQQEEQEQQGGPNDGREEQSDSDSDDVQIVEIRPVESPELKGLRKKLARLIIEERLTFLDQMPRDDAAALWIRTFEILKVVEEIFQLDKDSLRRKLGREDDSTLEDALEAVRHWRHHQERWRLVGAKLNQHPYQDKKLPEHTYREWKQILGETALLKFMKEGLSDGQMAPDDVITHVSEYLTLLLGDEKKHPKDMIKETVKDSYNLFALWKLGFKS